MFEWCEMTNKLKMKAGKAEPWIHDEELLTEPDSTWRYCSPCHGRWVNKTKNKKSFVTYRDKARAHCVMFSVASLGISRALGLYRRVNTI